jgi:hypothetical protein
MEPLSAQAAFERQVGRDRAADRFSARLRRRQQLVLIVGELQRSV